MSEITLFKQANAVIPDYIRADDDDFTRKMAGNPTGKSISIEGGVWRMIVGGEEIAKNEDRAMNFVVVNGSPNVSRVFYTGTYVKGQASAPACFSADGKAPDPTALEPQSSACATCPQNVEGSGEGTSRACRFFQRIAVVLEGVEQDQLRLVVLLLVVEHPPRGARRVVSPLGLQERRVPRLDDELTRRRGLLLPYSPPLTLDDCTAVRRRFLLVLSHPLPVRKFFANRFQFL